MQKLALSNRGNGSKHLIELEKVTTFLKKALTSKTTLLKQSFNPPTSKPSLQTTETLTTNTQTMKT